MLMGRIEDYTYEMDVERNREKAMAELTRIQPHILDYLNDIGVCDGDFEFKLDIAPITYAFSGYLEKANIIFGVDMELDDFKFE